MQKIPGSNKINVYPLMNLNSLINIEKEKSFDYLSKYMSYIPFDKLQSKYNDSVDELIKTEKILHDMIQHPVQHNINRLKAWIEYLNWIGKVFSMADIRYFLAQENFTKSTSSEKELFTQPQFVEHWMAYADRCADALDIIKYMRKFEISTKSSFFYFACAVIYEKEHDFFNANQTFLDGFEKKVHDPENLLKQYAKFEERMEGRINREVKASVFSSEEINEHIQTKLKKKNDATLNNGNFNANNKRLRPEEFGNNHASNFIIKKKKIEFCENANTTVEMNINNNNNNNNNDNINSIKYGQVPVFVDEEFRKNVITKGTKFVEVYGILCQFLNENDLQFKMSNDEFNKNHLQEKNRLPFSWINEVRIIPDRILNNNTESLSNISLNSRDGQAELQVQKKVEISNHEKKLEDVMSNMLKEINMKKEVEVKQEPVNIVTQAVPVKQINQIKEEKVILIPVIKNNNNEQEHVQNNINNHIPTNTTQQNNNNKNETIHYHDGNKYKIVKVETKINENIMINDFTKISEGLHKPSLQHIRINKYLEFAENTKKQKAAMEIQNKISKNKRKTIVYKVDADGDLCMDSDDEELEPVARKPIRTNKPIPVLNNNPKSYLNVNTTNDQAQYKVQSTHNISINLFNFPMTLDEINDKIKQTTEMYEMGKINIESRDLIYIHLEEKLIQIEQLEYEKNNKKKDQSNLMNSFTQLPINNNSKQLVSNNAISNNYNPFLLNETNKNNQSKGNELSSYLEPREVEIKRDKNNYNNNNINLQNNHAIQNNNNKIFYPFNPLPVITDLPNSILKKAINDTPYSNVSRSLDFTNIKLIESNNKNIINNNGNQKMLVPISTLFPAETLYPIRKIFFNDKKAPGEDMSISFGSEGSFIFDRADNLIKDEDEVDLTPNKRDSFQLYKAFNIKDTPQLLKKSFHEEIKPVDKFEILKTNNYIKVGNNMNLNNNKPVSNTSNNNYNYNNITNNNINKNFNEIKHNKYTDFNNVLDILDSDSEKKNQLSKLFGDAFCTGTKKDDISSQHQLMPYGLSSITEKTTENTYLSDNSFIFKN